MKLLNGCLLAGALAVFASHAGARVRIIGPTQTFTYPNSDYSLYGRKVAIDGDDAIAILNNGEISRRAVLFRRGADGVWVQGGTLLDVPVNANTPLSDDLAMENGVAAIRIGDVMHVFERSGTTWRESPAAGTPKPAPGLATSARRILAGRRGCNYDANVYTRSAGSGVWSVSGRASGSVGECNDHGAGLDIDGDVALVVNPPGEIREYRRNGTALEWPQVGALLAPAGVTFYSQAPTLRGDVAISSNGHFFLRANGAWDYQGKVQPLDSARGTYVSAPNYRDGLLMSLSAYNEQFSTNYPYLYQRNFAGDFEQVAVLSPSGNVDYADVSGNTAVASGEDQFGGDFHLDFYTLPSPIAAPAAIANDFEARDVTGFQQSAGSSFALATSGSNHVYRQSATAGESHAVLTQGDWADYQSIEADITPTAFDGNDRWFGLAVRYVDENNFYYVTLRSSGKMQLKRKLNGVFSTLAEQAVPVAVGQTYRVRLTVDDSSIGARILGQNSLGARDTALTHGRAALMTYRARADFDNLYVAPTSSISLANNVVGAYSGENFTYQGGKWQWTELPNGDLAESQTDTAADARAFFGTPTDDQRIDAHVRLDSFGSSASGAWFGVLGRWVDSRTYYYLSIRSTGRLEIRKQLNGTVTVLKSVPFTAAPGHFYDLRFEVLGNELHAFVDGNFVAGAIDGDIAKGRFGLGSYRSAFSYQRFTVLQP